jgi:hypothetical protein
MPPPPNEGFFSLNSATMQSVVSTKLDGDAAFCNAVRVTLVGCNYTYFNHAAGGSFRSAVVLVIFAF